MTLPSAYKQVKYIESSGTQYINTGYTPSSNTNVDLKISNWNISSSPSYIFGVYKNWVNNAFCIMGNSTWDGGINGTLLWNTTATALTSGGMGNGGTHTISLSSGGLYVDGTIIATGSGTFTATGNMFIFNNYKTDGSVISTERGAFKLYYFQIYDNGTLVRDFVPVIRKSDNKPGLYDLVNDIFYTNAGTGEFIAGPEEGKLPSTYKEVEYIQSSGTQYISTNIVPSNTKGIYIKLSSQDITTDLLYVGSRKGTDTRFWIGNSTNSYGNLYLGWNTNDRGVISTNTIFEAKLNYLNSRKKEVNDTVVLNNIGTLDSSNNVPLYIFAGNDNYSTDSSKYAPSKIKLYSCKISDGSEIVNDFVPCYRKSDNVTGMYDLVNDQFYTNAGTGTFIRGPIKDRGIPDDYTLVECIESTATNPGTGTSSGQYIDTLYTHNPNTKIEIDLQFKETTVQQRLFGSETVSSSYSTFSAYINGSGQWARATKDGEGNWQSTSVAADTNRHTYILDKTTYSIYTNGTQIHSGSNAYTITKNGTHSLLLLACYNDSTAQSIIEHASAKLYSCKIWDNGTLYRDMVPVIRKSDSKPGMYDIVTDTFYTNAGTGEFTYKEYAESGPIQKIYIGVNQSRPVEEPTPTTYNADLSTFTLMTTYWGGTPTYNNGIIKTTGEGGIAYKDISGELDVNNAKKIIIECDYYAVGKTWATTARVYLDNGVCNNKGQSQSGYSFGQWILTQTTSGYNTGTLVTFCGKSYGSATAGTEITYNTRHHLYAEFDIQNATWLCKVDDVQKGTGTLDSENITNYHNMNFSYINMYIETNNQIKNLSIQVTK